MAGPDARINRPPAPPTAPPGTPTMRGVRRIALALVLAVLTLLVQAGPARAQVSKLHEQCRNGDKQTCHLLRTRAICERGYQRACTAVRIMTGGGLGKAAKTRDRRQPRASGRREFVPIPPHPPWTDDQARVSSTRREAPPAPETAVQAVVPTPAVAVAAAADAETWVTPPHLPARKPVPRSMRR